MVSAVAVPKPLRSAEPSRVMVDETFSGACESVSGGFEMISLCASSEYDAPPSERFPSDAPYCAVEPLGLTIQNDPFSGTAKLSVGPVGKYGVMLAVPGMEQGHHTEASRLSEMLVEPGATDPRNQRYWSSELASTTFKFVSIETNGTGRSTWNTWNPPIWVGLPSDATSSWSI